MGCPALQSSLPVWGCSCRPVCGPWVHLPLPLLAVDLVLTGHFRQPVVGSLPCTPVPLPGTRPAGPQGRLLTLPRRGWRTQGGGGRRGRSRPCSWAPRAARHGGGVVPWRSLGGCISVQAPGTAAWQHTSPLSYLCGITDALSPPLWVAKPGWLLPGEAAGLPLTPARPWAVGVGRPRLSAPASHGVAAGPPLCEVPPGQAPRCLVTPSLLLCSPPLFAGWSAAQTRRACRCPQGWVLNTSALTSPVVTTAPHPHALARPWPSASAGPQTWGAAALWGLCGPCLPVVSPALPAGAGRRAAGSRRCCGCTRSLPCPSCRLFLRVRRAAVFPEP